MTNNFKKNITNIKNNTKNLKKNIENNIENIGKKIFIICYFCYHSRSIIKYMKSL